MLHPCQKWPGLCHTAVNTHQAGCWSRGCGGETAEGLDSTMRGFHWPAELVGSVWTASSPQCCRPAIGPRKRHYGNKRESWWGGGSVNNRQRAMFAWSCGRVWLHNWVNLGNIFLMKYNQDSQWADRCCIRLLYIWVIDYRIRQI